MIIKVFLFKYFIELEEFYVKCIVDNFLGFI